MRLIQGKGINDLSRKIRSKDFKSYDIWKGMLRRCYSKERIKFKCYNNVEVCEEWLFYSKFKKWYEENYPYEIEKKGYKVQLDKDLLSNENKIYSPRTCVFIPAKINSFMISDQCNNATGLKGVTFNKRNNSWVVKIRNFDNHGRIHLGCFSNKKTAGKAYLKGREVEAQKARKLLRELGYDNGIIKLIK